MFHIKIEEKLVRFKSKQNLRKQNESLHNKLYMNNTVFTLMKKFDIFVLVSLFIQAHVQTQLDLHYARSKVVVFSKLFIDQIIDIYIKIIIKLINNNLKMQKRKKKEKKRRRK